MTKNQNSFDFSKTWGGNADLGKRKYTFIFVKCSHSPPIFGKKPFFAKYRYNIWEERGFSRNSSAKMNAYFPLPKSAYSPLPLKSWKNRESADFSPLFKLYF